MGTWQLQVLRAPEPGALKNPFGKELPACGVKLFLSEENGYLVGAGQ